MMPWDFESSLGGMLTDEWASWVLFLTTSEEQCLDKEADVMVIIGHGEIQFQKSLPQPITALVMTAWNKNKYYII